MKLKFISIFPELVASYFEHGLVSQSKERKSFELEIINPRIFTTDKHRKVDDTPFGGGDGMIMLYEPLKQAVLKAKEGCGQSVRVINLSPQGALWTDRKAREWAKSSCDFVFVCGRYGGIDQRFINEFVTDEVSVGDYVLNGGELPSFIVAESMLRFLPGFMSNSESIDKDSFSNGLLEGPSFTKPRTIDGRNVPEVFLSGHHAKIIEAKEALMILATHCKRADLVANLDIKKIKAAAQTIKKLFSTTDLAACGWTSEMHLELDKLLTSEHKNG